MALTRHDLGRRLRDTFSGISTVGRSTSAARQVPDALVARVAGLDLSVDHVRSVIASLTAIGSSPLGYRNTGTPEDRAVADYVSAQMQAIGLTDVAIEPVRVDSWRFASADVRVGDELLAASGFGGVPGTPADGLTARLVDVRTARRDRLDRLDLGGAIALVEWSNKDVGPWVVALELLRRGVIGIVLTTGERGAWFRSDGALGAFDGQWPAGAPPMVMISWRDAQRLRELAPSQVTMRMQVEIDEGATGFNVVGYLRGTEPGPIIVGAHHDAWFRGAFDNTSGVAALLALARALVNGEPPRHTICFTSRTGEEYGRAGALHDWCTGAWEQIDTTHPEWAEQSPFHLCLEASGRPGLRTIVEAPVEYAAWARAVCRTAQAQGWTPTGWRVAPPVAGTEQWPLLVSGVPGVAAYAWETSFADTDYHSQFDTLDTVDCDIVVAQTRLYALLLLDADRRPDDIVDHRARARQLATIAQRFGSASLAAAAETQRHAVGRAAFTEVGRHLHALDSHAEAVYPHEQTAADLAALDAAVEALDRDDAPGALRQLRKVGSNRYHPYLSKDSLQAHLDRSAPEAVAGTWGEASHCTPSPNLWDEITALPSGNQSDRETVRASLERARSVARGQLHERLEAMARAISANGQP